MTKPLALVSYESLLPGSRLVHRLEDLGYRVGTVPDLQALAAVARAERPLVVIAEFEARVEAVCRAVRALRQDSETRHIPVLVYGGSEDSEALTAATAAGITLVAGAGAVLDQLPELLEQALRVD